MAANVSQPKYNCIHASRSWNQNAKDRQSHGQAGFKLQSTSNFLPLLLPFLCGSRITGSWTGVLLIWCCPVRIKSCSNRLLKDLICPNLSFNNSLTKTLAAPQLRIPQLRPHGRGLLAGRGAGRKGGGADGCAVGPPPPTHCFPWQQLLVTRNPQGAVSFPFLLFSSPSRCLLPPSH